MKEGEGRKTVFDILKMISESKELELEDVVVDAEELTLELSTTPAGKPEYLKLTLEPITPGAQKIEFLVETTPYGVRLVAPTVPVPPAIPIEKPKEFIELKFEYPVVEYPGRIVEIVLGATREQGGTRGKIIKIGGDKSPPFYLFESKPVNRPVVALDVFDTPPPLAGPVKRAYQDVLQDPAEWARKCINTYNADLISLHLVSTDPLGEDKPVKEALKTVENVLQAVDIPIIIGGSGNPQKDVELFTQASEVFAGERLVMASITLDMNIPKVVEPIRKYEHNAIALAFMDINQAKELSRKILDAGLPKDHLILDPTTGALGYGIEYTYSTMERIRLSALMGEETLQVPLSCAATNAWAAREAWMKIDEWGPRELRGPLYEATTALVGLLAGANLFMMMHPLAMKIVKSFAEAMIREEKKEEKPYLNWIKTKF
ncbi:MAG: CO dehydrogenase/acetyl-CoA synthase subunit delta [Candidatus Methanomethylicia archaeon]